MNSCMPSAPVSRPYPDFLIPSKVPVRVVDVDHAGVNLIRDAPPALEIARVDRAAEAVFGVLATAIAVSSPGTVITAATGPKSSSSYAGVPFSTFARMVGSKKALSGEGRFPPRMTRAPPATERLTWSSSLAAASTEDSGAQRQSMRRVPS